MGKERNYSAEICTLLLEKTQGKELENLVDEYRSGETALLEHVLKISEAIQQRIAKVDAAILKYRQHSTLSQKEKLLLIAKEMVMISKPVQHELGDPELATLFNSREKGFTSLAITLMIIRGFARSLLWQLQEHRELPDIWEINKEPSDLILDTESDAH